MTVHIAILGAGWIGDIHAKAIKNQTNAKLIGIVDTNQEKAIEFAKKHSIPNIYFSLDELLDSHTADAIVIGTPNYLHAAHSIAALRAGLHVLVEKPMAMSVDEAKMMQKESELTSSVLMIGHCWRYDNEVTWMRKQIAEDRLGKIVKTKGCSSHVNWGPSGWFTQKQLSGGGALVDMGIHAIDTARFLLGDPQPASVFARIGTYYGKYDVDDTGIIIIGWKSGTTSYLEFGWWQPHSDGPEAATQLYGIKGFGSVFPSYIKETNSDQQNNEIPENGFKFPREDHAAQEMYDNQMRHFISCIINKADPISSSEIGITNMRILEAAYKSNEEGEIIRLS